MNLENTSSNDQLSATGPHAGGKIYVAGEPLATAKGAMLMVHGRGATAADILSLSAELDVPGFAYIAPQAVGIHGIHILL